LIVAVPEAEAIVREIRLRHVSSAAHGVAAHITVLSPFEDGDDIAPRRCSSPQLRSSDYPDYAQRH
jgi:hypothetical protein